jgi:chromosome segregation ATPase
MDNVLTLTPEEQEEVDSLRNEIAEIIARVGQLELQKYFHDEEIMNAKMRFRTLALREKDLRQKLTAKYGSLEEIDALVGIII